ncbi:MAG: FKBP-type peptidyl-prolyl cis-trans isomerase [Niabella sp.]|nr:FKBP-type peptidyl-prolyl cis-trans isomerase [Niabella sp.]
MRKLFGLAIVAAVAALIVASCMKNNATGSCTPQPVAAEMPTMQKYAADSSITATQDATGILYQIIDPGTGAQPAATDSITINYVGRLVSTGQLFDANNNVTFKLSELIEGWQIGIPKIKVGGKIKLIMQSSLAYGCTGAGPIAPNQPLYFYIELLGTKSK